MNTELTIDKEFQSLLPGLTVEEKTQLRHQIEADGCTDPIITWANHDDTIIDGYHRYDICQQLGKPFKSKSLRFDNRDEVKAWILARQGGRRNISQAKLRYIRGQAYNERKCSHGASNGESRSGGRQVLSGHDVHLKKTAEVIASEYGVNEKTIRRDAKFADQLNELSSSERKSILDGTRKSLPTNGESHSEEIIDRLKQGPATRDNLLSISSNYTARITELRDKGHNIVCDGDLYRLESGKPKKNKPKLPSKFRYEKPEGTDGAITRMKEIVKECHKISKGNRFQVNHEKILRFVRELGELVECFEVAGKK